MEIRRATVADAPAISALNATVQGLHAAAHPHIFKPPAEGPAEASSFPPDEVAALLACPDNTLLLALVDDHPAGYIYTGVSRRPESHRSHARTLLYIHHISVDPAYQGQGVGHALMDAAKALARELGIAHIELDVWAFNDRARRFFESHGFRTYNLRMWTDLSP